MTRCKASLERGLGPKLKALEILHHELRSLEEVAQDLRGLDEVASLESWKIATTWPHQEIEVANGMLGHARLSGNEWSLNLLVSKCDQDGCGVERRLAHDC